MLYATSDNQKNDITYFIGCPDLTSFTILYLLLVAVSSLVKNVVLFFVNRRFN